MKEQQTKAEIKVDEKALNWLKDKFKKGELKGELAEIIWGHIYSASVILGDYASTTKTTGSKEMPDEILRKYNKEVKKTTGHGFPMYVEREVLELMKLSASTTKTTGAKEMPDEILRYLEWSAVIYGFTAPKNAKEAKKMVDKYQEAMNMNASTAKATSPVSDEEIEKVISVINSVYEDLVSGDTYPIDEWSPVAKNLKQAIKALRDLPKSQEREPEKKREMSLDNTYCHKCYKFSCVCDQSPTPNSKVTNNTRNEYRDKRNSKTI